MPRWHNQSVAQAGPHDTLGQPAMTPRTPSISQEQRKRLLERATAAALTTAIVLGIVKLFAWWWSGSVAVLASAVDSVLDVSASLFNLLAVRYALKPPDAEHRFGHGKSEALAGLAQALLISGSGVYILLHAIERWSHPQPLAAVPLSLALLLFCLLATIALVAYQRSVVRATGSTAIAADALHYASDIASNVGTALALACAQFGFPQLDSVFGCIIAAITLYSAIKVGRESFEVLMDRELPNAARERIREIALSHVNARGLHDLRTRRSGAATQVQFHLELDGGMTVKASNDVVHEIVQQIAHEFPGADVIIHQDPVMKLVT
ncbi:MAG: divalent metal cation transporter FieF [Pseudomonadota bacterium]